MIRSRRAAPAPSSPPPASERPAQLAAVSSGRSRFVLGLLGLAFVGLACRAAYVQLIGNDFFQDQGNARFTRTLELPANRGRILDRNGTILATSSFITHSTMGSCRSAPMAHRKRHVDEVEHAGHAGVHHVLHAARVLVEGGQGRAADGAHLGDGKHVAQVHQVQRGFAHHQHQLAALFEHDVGRAGEQVVAQPVGNRGQGAHGAGRHHHGVAAKGPAGQRGAHVAHIVQLVAGGQGLQRGGAVHTAFVLQGAPACV